MTDALARLTQAERLLAEATVERLPEVSQLSDLAEVARTYAERAKLGTKAINHAQKVKLAAERKMADLVDEGQANGQIAGQGKPSKTLPPVRLRDIGIGHKRLSEARAIRDTFTADEVEEIVSKANDADKEVSRTELLKVARRRRRQEVEHTPAMADAELPDADFGDGRIRLLHGDFRERLMSLEAASVDLIVTDPPYPKEDLPLWSDLAQVAAKILAPRGLMFAYTGQIFLPEVIERVSEHLTYGWTFALHLPGSGSRIMGRHIIQAWKPVVAFSTGTWPSGEWGDDFLISPSREKAEYEWQQNALPAQRIIERYSAPDGLVVDPFLGVGSFAKAAQEAGRRFVGVELDEGRFRKASELIA